MPNFVLGSAMQFSVHESEGQGARLTASGDVDVAVADQLADLATAALLQMTGEVLVIDLADVTFMDSTGLGALVTVRNESIRVGKRLTLANVPEQVRQILAITGLDGVFAQVDG